jgi:hypothetical protein
VNVVPELVCVVGIGTTGAFVDDFVVGVAGADQHDGRTPFSVTDPAPRERVAEHRHQLSVRRHHGRPEIGGRDSPVFGEARTREVDDLAVE